MNRLTRPLNLFNPTTRLLLQPTTIKLHPRISAARFHLRRRPHSLSVSVSVVHRITMDSDNSPANLSGSVIDDFVNVQNPTNELDNHDPNLVAIDSDDNGGVRISDDNGGERIAESEGANNAGESESRSLPQELSRNVVVLSCNNGDGYNCDVYLVGTAHESCREVQAVISFLKPEVVFLELCSSRVSILTLKDLKIPTMTEMIDSWKKKQNIFGILYGWFLAKVADKLEVLPGSEFRVAFEEAMKLGSKVVLGDRPVQVTLRRTWSKMPLWHKIKLVYSFLFQAVFLPGPDDINRMLKEMDDVDMLTFVIQEMSKEFPTLMETLVNERDLYMSSTLLRVAREHTSVVAVVGKGHLQGIKRNWEQPVEVADLMEIPTSRPFLSAVKVLTTVGVAVAGAAVVSGIYLASKKQT
uniref:TraB family protein n=1 Tax=Chenopodium quinoa TaxID=63459 RepID=A0A803M841_CHEQI